MPDLVSGIGIIKVNKTAYGPRQLNHVEKIGMETEKYNVTGGEQSQDHRRVEAWMGEWSTHSTGWRPHWKGFAEAKAQDGI